VHIKTRSALDTVFSPGYVRIAWQHLDLKTKKKDMKVERRGRGPVGAERGQWE
jgi:hypothetical protein